MIDLTAISEPFGQLDEETRARLREHERLGGIIILVRCNNDKSVDNVQLPSAGVFSPNKNWAYRAKSNDIPASVDWSHVRDGYNHIRVDKNEFVLLYRNKPILLDGKEVWQAGAGDFFIATHDYHCILASFRRGNMAWSDVILDRVE